MRNRIILLAFCFVLCVCVAGCSGARGGIDEVFPHPDGTSSIIISPRYVWPDAPDADKISLAQRGVDAAVEAYAKQQNDEEYGHLYDQDLHTVVGYFNGQAVFYYNIDTAPEVTIDQSAIVANIPSDMAVQSVSDILLFGIEGNEAYFNAYLAPGIDWDYTDDQERIIENVVAYCEAYAENEATSSFEVICFTDGMQRTAFVYKGGDTVQVYSTRTGQVEDYVLSE